VSYLLGDVLEEGLGRNVHEIKSPMKQVPIDIAQKIRIDTEVI